MKKKPAKHPVDSVLRDALIKSGVSSLKKSYPGVSKDNLLTDYIYRHFFKSGLEELLEKQPQLKPEIEALIAEIDACKEGV